MDADVGRRLVHEPLGGLYDGRTLGELAPPPVRSNSPATATSATPARRVFFWLMGGLLSALERRLGPLGASGIHHSCWSASRASVRKIPSDVRTLQPLPRLPGAGLADRRDHVSDGGDHELGLLVVDFVAAPLGDDMLALGGRARRSPRSSCRPPNSLHPQLRSSHSRLLSRRGCRRSSPRTRRSGRVDGTPAR
jgi:hypothetical protein